MQPVLEPRKVVMCHGRHCCSHTLCVPRKKQAWCQRWFFLTLGSLREVYPDEMMDYLDTRLSGYDFDFVAAVSMTPGENIYRVLLKVDPTTGRGSVLEKLTPSPFENCFDPGYSNVKCLSCCDRALKWNVKLWLKLVEERPGYVVINNGDLGRHLKNDMKVTTPEAQALDDVEDAVVAESDFGSDLSLPEEF